MNIEKLTEIYRKYKHKFILTHMLKYTNIESKHDQYIIKTVMCNIFSKEERKLILRISRIDKLGYRKSYRQTLIHKYGVFTKEDLEDIKKTLNIEKEEYLTLDFQFDDQELNDRFSNKILFFTNNCFFEKKENTEAYLQIAKNNMIYVPDGFELKEYLRLLLGEEDLERQYNEITEGGE